MVKTKTKTIIQIDDVAETKPIKRKAEMQLEDIFCDSEPETADLNAKKPGFSLFYELGPGGKFRRDSGGGTPVVFQRLRVEAKKQTKYPVYEEFLRWRWGTKPISEGRSDEAETQARSEAQAPESVRGPASECVLFPIRVEVCL